jgi:HNH endonuclease
MSKNFGKNILNESFSSSIEQKVWEKGTVVEGYDASMYRKDKCGAWMQKNLRENGSELSLHWEIDHKNPTSKGGNDDLDNLQPLQWENNRGKDNNYPEWNCKVTSDGSLKNKYK